MRIALGSDHAGFDLKALLAKSLADWGYDTLDLGTDNATDSVDYPDFGAAVGRSVASGECDLGVAICGTGIGISIAANKVPGVRAAVVHDVTSAHLAREHNHANVLCLGARLTGAVGRRRGAGGVAQCDAGARSPRDARREARRTRRASRRR